MFTEVSNRTKDAVRKMSLCHPSTYLLRLPSLLLSDLHAIRSHAAHFYSARDAINFFRTGTILVVNSIQLQLIRRRLEPIGMRLSACLYLHFDPSNRSSHVEGIFHNTLSL